MGIKTPPDVYQRPVFILDPAFGRSFTVQMFTRAIYEHLRAISHCFEYSYRHWLQVLI